MTGRTLTCHADGQEEPSALRNHLHYGRCDADWLFLRQAPPPTMYRRVSFGSSLCAQPCDAMRWVRYK